LWAGWFRRQIACCEVCEFFEFYPIRLASWRDRVRRINRDIDRVLWAQA